MQKKLRYFLIVLLALAMQSRAMHVADSLALLQSNLQALNQAIISQPRECEVCYAERPRRAFIRWHCGHESCAECLGRQLDLTLGEQRSSYLRCPACAQKCPLEYLGNIARSPSELTTLTRILFQEWACVQEGYKHCPTPGCSFMFFNSKQAPREAMRCPECVKEYCTECLVSHAIETPCEDIKLSAEERENREWKRQHTKKCPVCKVEIEKNAGCQKISCKCGHYFCWTCLKPFYPPGMSGGFYVYSAGHEDPYACRVATISGQSQQFAVPQVPFLAPFPKAYIINWTVGLSEKSENLKKYLDIKQLPVFVRIGFSQSVNDVVADLFFEKFSQYYKQQKPKRGVKFPGELVLELPPATSRVAFQQKLDEINDHIWETYYSYVI